MSDEVKDVTPEDVNNMTEPMYMRGIHSAADQYEIYNIPKKSGGHRVIEAPCDALKASQQAALRKLNRTMEVSHFAHAFAWGKNIASCAKPHVGAPVVLTVDLTDFFPSIKWDHFDPDSETASNLRSYGKTFEYVFGKRRTAKTGDWMKTYREEIIPLLRMQFCDFGDGKGLRLPQGAPASPLISNALLCRLDYRIAWAGYKQKVEYTRYADDLIFSGETKEAVQVVYARAVALLSTLGLEMNKRKYTLKQGNQRKKIVGLVVNEKLNTTRYFRRRLRAMNHHCDVIFTLIELSKERNFRLPKRLKPFLLSKTDGMTFGQKMRSIVDEIKQSGGDISMEDLQGKKLRDSSPAYTSKIQGHRAFQHMVENPPKNVQSSLEFCAVSEMLRMA